MNLPRIGIINVGANTSHGTLRSPVLSDGRIDMVPIPERGYRHREEMPRYRDLEWATGLETRDFIPYRLWDDIPHNDPEFKTPSYGDVISPLRQNEPRSIRLGEMGRGDIIIFIANLTRFDDGRFIKGTGSLYLICHIKIKEVFRLDSDSTIDRIDIENNHHVRLMNLDRAIFDNDYVFLGEPDSGKYDYAVPFEFDTAQEILRDKDGERFTRNPNQNDISRLASYTRTFRPQTGPNLEHRMRMLSDLVNKYNQDVRFV